MAKDKWKTLLERALPSVKTVGEFLGEHPAQRSKVLLKNDSIIDDETSLANTEIFGSLADITVAERRLYVIKYSSGSASFTLPQEVPFSVGQCLNDLFPDHTFLADFYNGTANQNYELPGDRELTSLDAAKYTWSRAIYVYDNETTFQVSFKPSSPDTLEALITMDLPLSYRVPGKALFNLDSIISFATEKFSKEFSFTLNLKQSFVVPCKRANGLVVPITLKPLGEINTEKLTKTVDITELEDYEQIAQKLKDGTYIKKFIKLVDTIHENISGRHDQPITLESDLNSTYIAVLGPSGSGKTQLAYALNAADCSCVHLLMLEEYKDAQSIYQASKSLSRSFLKAIDEDVIELGKSHKDVCELVSSCNFLVKLKGKRLSTIGFLHSVLSARLERDSSAWKAFLNQNATHTYELMSAETFFWIWKDKPIIPCIILDEFNLEYWDSIDEIKERELIPLFLARNVIRALGLVCITMGTNSAASNLIAPDFLGREGTAHLFVEGSTAWVFVVHKLQPVVVDAVPGYAEFRTASSRFRNNEIWSPFFQWLEVDMNTSNPRLLRFAFAGLTNYFNDRPDSSICTVQNALTQMMTHMVNHTIGTKYIGTPYFRWALLGQIGHLIAHSDNHFCSHLIHTYFNHLLPPSQWTATSSGVRVNVPAAQPFREFLIDDDFCCLLLRARDESGQIFLSTTTGISWRNAESYFPSVDEDNLLALALLTFSDPGCFFLDGSSSLYKALFRTFLSTMHPGKDLRRGQAATATTKGYLWEIIMHLSAIISSVSLPGKLNGTPIDHACLEIMRNLHKGTNVHKSLTASNECHLRYFCGLLKDKCPKLPMLGPVDDSFGFLKKFIPDALVGMLRSCENTEQVDGVIDSCSVNGEDEDLPDSEGESTDEDVDKENDVYDRQPNDPQRNESTKRYIVSSDSSGDVTFILEGKARAIGKNIGNGVIGSVAGKGERVLSSCKKRVIFLYSFGAKFNAKAAKRRWLPERHQAVFLSSASGNELKFTGYAGNGRKKDATMIDSTTFKSQTMEESKTNVNGRSADEITTIIVILAARGVYEEAYIIDDSDIQHGVNLLEPYLKAQQGIDNLLKRRIVIDEDSPAAKRIKDRL